MKTPRGHEERTRLTHRAALLSLGAALFFFTGLITFGTAVQETEDVLVRTASGAPFALALGGAVGARACRAKLNSLPPEQDGSSAS
jgi:hypothetical protein